MKKLFKYFKPEIPAALLGILFVATVAYIELYQIQLMAEIIDVGIANADFDAIMSVGAKMIGLALLGAVIAMLGLYFPSQVSNNFALKLRHDVFAKVQKFSIKNMNVFQTSSLVTRLTNDINFLQRTLMMCLRLLVRAPVFLISTVVMTYVISPELSWVMLVAVFGLSLVLTYIVIQGFPRFVWLQTRIDNLNRKVQESLSNIRVIKSFVREDFEDERFKVENEDLNNASIRANMLMVLMNPSMMAAINFATIFVVWISARLIVDVQMFAVGDLLTFITYLRFTMFSMMMLTNVLMMVSRSRASVIRIVEVLDSDVDITSPVSSVSLQDNPGKIEFRKVSFRYYESATDVLKNISFTVNPGEHVGIIGSTGSGKSTLINLLARLIDVSGGEILLDDHNIETLDLKFLRSQFGFVPQKNVLFSGTIAENLRLGNADASMDLLQSATQAASIYDYVAGLPKGFDSPVQQGGTNFSGGQRQRLCIARALVNQPKVLILDDSTSALDSATEEQVKRSLNESFSDMTLISIAQKISSVSDCDRIIVLDEGQIVGSGTHDELLSDNMIYQEIYQSQIKKGALE